VSVSDSEEVIFPEGYTPETQALMKMMGTLLIFVSISDGRVQQAITRIFLKVFKNSDGYNHTYGFQKSLVRSIDSQDF
jgi:hypothetical protein